MPEPVTFTIDNASLFCGLPVYVLIAAVRAGKLTYSYSGIGPIPDRGDGLTFTQDALSTWLASRTRDQGVS